MNVCKKRRKTRKEYTEFRRRYLSAGTRVHFLAVIHDISSSVVDYCKIVLYFNIPWLCNYNSLSKDMMCVKVNIYLQGKLQILRIYQRRDCTHNVFSNNSSGFGNECKLHLCSVWLISKSPGNIERTLTKSNTNLIFLN